MPRRKVKATSERKGVKTMSNLPGFTARASLYGTSEPYTAVGTLSTYVGNRAVVPQICITVPFCVPIIKRRIRVCCSLFPPGCSWSWGPHC